MIQIIDYGAGNIYSICNALKQLGETYRIVRRNEDLRSDMKLIFPGVGAAGSAMKNLKGPGFDFRNFRMPFLGICLGMQLLFDYSQENNCKCLGIVEGRVVKFGRPPQFDNPQPLKVPQIGWNSVKKIKDDPLFKSIPDDSYFYFVNSYYVKTRPKYVLGETLYGENFASVIKNRNFYGVQFHPEKSGEVGFKLLNNFCKLC